LSGLIIRLPQTATLFPYTNALPISTIGLRTISRQIHSPQKGHLFPFVGPFLPKRVLFLRPQYRTYWRALSKLPHKRVCHDPLQIDRKSTRLNSSHVKISYAVFCLKK